MSNTNLSERDERLLKECGQMYLIGRLRGNNPIQVTPNSNIRFYVEVLCDEPKVVSELDIFDYEDPSYIGFDNAQDDEVLPDYYDKEDYDTDRKLDSLTDHLYNQLILFTPNFKINSKDQRWYKNLYVARRFPLKDQYAYFSAVPKVSYSNEEFERYLKNGILFDLEEFNGEIQDAPEIILCGDYAYCLLDSSEGSLVENSTQYPRKWQCSDVRKVIKIHKNKFMLWSDYVIDINDHLCFMEDSLRNEIMVDGDYETLDEIKKDIVEPKKEDTVISPVVKEIPQQQTTPEIEFLLALEKVTMERRLSYRYADLINFHTSVKTNPLTIIAGMSGTGKTQLALNYAKMLNLSEKDQTLLFMPISPSYSEPSDVLGYLNSMNNSYVPSETGLVKFLKHASDHKDLMHMVIFDEMNLSQVEHWFSPFISILEKDVGERILRLYDSDSEVENADKYPAYINIGENVFFVGTVNIDDTTKDFSDRLLDRTFVVTLEKGKFRDFFDQYQNDAIEEIDIEKNKCKSVDEFQKWNQSSVRNYMQAFIGHEDELEFLDYFDEIIREYIPDGGISYRVLKNIGNYINNIPLKSNGDMLLDRNLVFDIIVNQTVMTKIRGTETQLEELIGNKEYDTGLLVNSKILDLLDEYSSISEFKKVRLTLKKKAEDLRINGYTN